MTPAKKSGPAPGRSRSAPRQPPASAPGRGKVAAAQRGSGHDRPSQPTAAPQWPTGPRSTSTTPTACGCRSCSPRRGSARAGSARTSSRQGRVEVDGQVVTELGVRIRPTQTVHVDGVRIQLDESRVYLAFNKPLGVVTSMSDELGRVDIGDFVANRKERLFHVGRLDADTEGLLLLTNDGDLAHRLQHPRYGVLKTYLAQIPGPVPRDLGRRLREGIQLEDGPVAVDSFKVVDSRPGKALVEVVLHEGRKHIVRRMLAEVGHPVITLVRTQVGPIQLGDTKPGEVAQPHEHGGRRPLRGGGPVTRVHVVGTGLLGTSLGLALRRLDDDVTLEDTSPTAAALARDLGAGRLPDGEVRARPRRRRDAAGRHRARAWPTRCAAGRGRP